MKIIDNGTVTSPQGFLAAGIVAGLKRSGSPDMALLMSTVPCQFAAGFTVNRMAAAPVQYCRAVCDRAKTVRAVIINSGNANACTGAKGLQNATEMAARTAQCLRIEADEVLVSSTGRIGIQMPMEKILNGIGLAAQSLSTDGGQNAAAAIMTTDTKKKSVAVQTQIDGKTVTIGAMAKGSGMIAPHMEVAGPHATMLAYITTDANVDGPYLNGCLKRVLERSFNRISVDGDMSTNDTVIVLANGLAGNSPIRPRTAAARRFEEALTHVAATLARMMVLDGEGATKFVEVQVHGAKNNKEARQAAAAIANSLLCKTAWFGQDPNWGRIIDAVGYSGVQVIPDRVALNYDDVAVVRGGMDAGADLRAMEAVLKKPEFVVRVDLGIGTGSYTYWTCDLSYDYVKINADYRT